MIASPISGMHAATVAAVVTLAGCSLLYDPSEFEDVSDGGSASFDAGVVDAPMSIDAPPGAADAAVDAPGAIDATSDAPIVDAGPPILGGIEPTALDEGSGSSQFGPPVPIVVQGDDLANDAVLSVSDGTIAVGDTTVSSDGTRAATTLRIPADTGLDVGEDRSVMVTLTQGGFSESVSLTIRGLDELTIDGGQVSVGPDTFASLYSTITVSADTRLVGEAPVRLEATGDIIVNGAVNLNGDQAGVPGAGGCAGGKASTSASCGGSGGQAGGTATVGSGGGGGGNAASGTDGEGLEAGTGGSPNGNLFVAPVDNARGNGGGGGGDGDSGPGGQGGGGGGVVEITSHGDLHLNDMVTTAGGPGDAGDGNLCSTHGGGGGGGSGGAILVRAHGSVLGSGSLIGAPGGQGGNGGASCNAGGAGSTGRVRVDNAADVTDLVFAPTPVRGPMWDESTPSIVTTTSPALTIVGQPNTTFAYSIDGGSPESATTDGSGSVTILPGLSAGLHTICALVSPSISQTLEEAKNCRSIAVLP